MMTTPKAQIIALLNTQTHHFNGRPINGINARQLHQALGVGKMYAHWIKARIKQGQFIEEMDFITVQNSIIDLPKQANQKGGNLRAVEYIISVDMAKHLCLMEKTEIAHAIRRHFIEAEAQLRQLAPEHHEALMQRTQTRLHSIETHKDMTAAVQQWLNRTGGNIAKQPLIQMAEAKMINALVLNENPDQYRKRHQIKASLRANFSPEQLSLTAYLETQNIALLECDMPYAERKQRLTALAARKRKPFYSQRQTQEDNP